MSPSMIPCRASHLVLDVLGNVAVEAAERREAYALVVQPELDDLAAGEVVVAGVLYSLEDGVVHPLDHGGQDGCVGEELGLVGVDADCEDALLPAASKRPAPVAPAAW